MFWSKIWFFLVAVLAAAAITGAFLMPRAVERESQERERDLVQRACSVTEILLRDNARTRVEFASQFARRGAERRIDSVAQSASAEADLDRDTIRDGHDALEDLIDHIEGSTPTFAALLDTRGRVVASAGTDAFEPGQGLRGRPLVDEVLIGYVRDDVWVVDGELYRVAGAPLERRDSWVGGIVLGHDLDNAFADRIAETLEVDVAFYAAGEPLATSSTARIHDDVLATYAEADAAAEERAAAGDCGAFESAVVYEGSRPYRALSARLPGEAGQVDGFYTVFVEHTDSIGTGGMLARVQREDLSMSNFPWIPVVLGVLVVIAGGLVLLAFEGDRPLRRLNDEAVELAKAERERFDEDRHRGKFGSIARSVNISVDKLKREAKAARRDLDELLGPAPEPSVRASMPDMGAGLGSPSGGAPAAESGGKAPPAPPPSAFTRPEDGGPGAGAPGPSTGGGPAPGSGSGGSAKPPPAPASAAGPAGKAGAGGPPPVPPAASGGAAKAGPGASAGTPPPIPKVEETGPRAIADDILGAGGEDDDDDSRKTRAEGLGDDFDDAATYVAEGGGPVAENETYFREIYDEFLAMKRACGEDTKNLTFETFADKLRNNRDDLIAKHGCKSVRFQVYEKNGRAALKASPIKS